MKRLGYILIPVLAVLLMSHNSFALDNKFIPYTCYDIVGQGITCGNYAITTGNTIQVVSVAKSNNTDLSIVWGEHFLWALNVRSYGTQNTQLGINLANGYPELVSIDDIWQDCNTTNGYTSCNILVSGIIRDNNWNVQLAGQVTGFGATYTIDSLYFSADRSLDVANYQNIQQIKDYLQNHPEPSAQDIADAVNGQQEAAGQTQSDAGDTAADNSEQAVDNATQSLFSAMGTVVSALRDTPASDCLITVSSVGSSQVFTSAIGQLNVCSVPSGILAIVQGLAALVIVPMVLMACYSLLHKIYNAFKEVQDT